MHFESMSDADLRCTSLLVLVPRGTDRSSAGRVVVARIVSRDDNDRRRVVHGVHPDLIELAVPPSKSSVGIDRIRSVLHDAQFAPQEGLMKICLIPHAEQLTREASNALLKVLEEPPSRFGFVLLAETAQDVLPTVRSRSRVLRIGKTSVESQRQRLSKMGYDPDETEYIIEVSQGCDSALCFFLDEKRSPLQTRDQLHEKLSSCSRSDLLQACTDSHPVTRYEASLCLLDQLLKGDRQLAVATARAFGRLDRTQLSAWLEQVLGISQRLLRLTHGTLAAAQGMSSLAERLTTDDALRLATNVETALYSVNNFVNSEAAVLSTLKRIGGEARG